MEVNSLEKAVENLSKVLKEIKQEIREYDTKKSLWYDHQLEQFYGGLMTREEFNEYVWKKYLDASTLFEVTHIVEMLSSLERRYDVFLSMRKKLDSLIEGSIERVPDNWHRWFVTFKQRPCEVHKTVYLYAPDEEQAEVCARNVYESERFPIEIVSVEMSLI